MIFIKEIIKILWGYDIYLFSVNNEGYLRTYFIHYYYIKKMSYMNLKCLKIDLLFTIVIKSLSNVILKHFYNMYQRKN